MDSNLSYLNKPVVGGYIYEALPERLRKLAEEDGDREAFIYYDKNWIRYAITRKELHDRSMSLAKVFVQEGLRQKANVGFCMSNSIEMLVANMAVVCAGGVPFYMGTNLKDGSDVIHLMNDMKCEMLFIDTDKGDANWKILENIWPEKRQTSETIPSLRAIVYNRNEIDEVSKSRTPLSFLMNITPDLATRLPNVQPEDPIAIFCTSGSTGKPKEVIYTHFCIFNWTKQTDYHINLKEASRFFNDRTFSWVFGYPRTYLTEGTTRIFIDPTLSSSGKHIEKICDVISAENCDVIYIPNYLAVDLLDNKHLAPKFKTVQTILSSGERFQSANIALKGTFCKSLYAYYGNTEAGGALMFESSDPASYDDGIIGEPLGGMEVKLIDQSGRTVQRGTRGELCLRSSWRFVGYRGRPDLFRVSVDDSNWFHTGDIAHVRDDGNFVMEGREKELISMQTNKFFPWAIEDTLKKMPGITNAFAVGVPDKRSFEVVCACVVPKANVAMTSDDVKKYCDDVFLDESSALVVTTKPAYHVVMEEVPLTRSGKLDRLKIKAIAKEQLGL